MYKIHLNEQKFPMTNYLRDFIRIVLLSNDALQADIQRIQILQKVIEKEMNLFSNSNSSLLINNV